MSVGRLKLHHPLHADVLFVVERLPKNEAGDDADEADEQWQCVRACEPRRADTNAVQKYRRSAQHGAEGNEQRWSE